jgi:hypothetical protein
MQHSCGNFYIWVWNMQMNMDEYLYRYKVILIQLSACKSWHFGVLLLGTRVQINTQGTQRFPA